MRCELVNKRKKLLSGALLGLVITAGMPAWAEVPKITGSPVVVSPEGLLDWPQDFEQTNPYLTEPTANRLNDFHGEIDNCDIVLSTAGNYHMALREIWQVFLKDYAADLGIKNWFYTTSPPVPVEQVQNKVMQFGNLTSHCVPQVAVGPGKLIEKMVSLGLTEGEPVPVVKNYGNVIFVKKGNPKHIKTVWDLGRPDVTLVTPNPTMEAGSFANFSGSIYDIAANDPNKPKNMSAEQLFDKIFNGDQKNCGGKGRKCKWVTGKRIMHREQPWAVANGKADAGFIFYHLALYFVRTFPDQFEIVSLGGTADKPEPVAGNKVAVLQAVRVKGDWNETQLKARDKLMEALASPQAAEILAKHGMSQPKPKQ